MFLRELAETDRPGEPPGSADADPTLEADLAAACARGHAAFGNLALDDPTFAKHLARRHQDEWGRPERDLRAGDRGSVSRLRLPGGGRRGRRRVQRASRRDDPGSDRPDRRAAQTTAKSNSSSSQSLWSAPSPAPARIGSYAGKAPLDRWLGVAAQRAALMWLRENRTEARARDGAAAEPAASGNTHPEMAFLKDRYRGEFEQALKESLGRLPERERTLLRLHLVNGVSVEKIGQMFAVSQPTASRWLAAARETLLDDIKATLGNRLGASSQELASLAGMVASRLDLSLSMLLRAR